MEIKKVLANVSQKLTETEKSTARKNIGVVADLLQSTDESMTFTDTDNDKIGIALNGYDTIAGNGIVIDTDDLNHTFSIRTSETYDTVVNLDTTLASGKYKLADNAGGTGPSGVDLTHGTLTVATSVSYTDTSHIGNQMVSDAYQMLITADGVPYYRTYNGKTKEFTEWVAGFGPKGDNIYLDEAKTTVMYTTSTSARTPKSIDDPTWSTTIPSVQQGQYLWVRTILAFSDESTADPIYNVVYKAKDIELDSEKTKVEYGTSSSGTDSTSVKTWSTSIPSVQQGQYLWVRTTLAFTDNSTADPIYNVVYQPKDIKLDSDNTKVEYGIAKSKDATPSSWSTSVPAIDQGDYLWVRTTMHFSDGSDAPAFCHVIYEPKDIKINSTTFRYASSTSGTTKPTSFSTTMPSVPQGNYLWTESVLNFSDGTSSSPYYSAVYQPKDINLDTTQTTVKYGKSTSSTTEPSSWTTSIPSLSQGDYLWTKMTLTFSDGNSAPDIKQCVYQPKDIKFSSATVKYASSTSGTTKPTSFDTTMPSVPQGNYLWTEIVLNFSDGSSASPYYSVEYQPKDLTVKTTTVQYAKSSTDVRPTSGWTGTAPTVGPGEYLWSQTNVTFSDDNTLGPVYMKSYQGKNGTNGTNGLNGSHFYQIELNKMIIVLDYHMCDWTITDMSTGSKLSTIPDLIDSINTDLSKDVNPCIIVVDDYFDENITSNHVISGITIDETGIVSGASVNNSFSYTLGLSTTVSMFRRDSLVGPEGPTGPAGPTGVHLYSVDMEMGACGVDAFNQIGQSEYPGNVSVGNITDLETGSIVRADDIYKDYHNTSRVPALVLTGNGVSKQGAVLSLASESYTLASSASTYFLSFSGLYDGRYVLTINIQTTYMPRGSSSSYTEYALDLRYGAPQILFGTSGTPTQIYIY